MSTISNCLLNVPDSDLPVSELLLNHRRARLSQQEVELPLTSALRNMTQRDPDVCCQQQK